MKLKVRPLTKAERVARAERKQVETSRLEAIADAAEHREYLRGQDELFNRGAIAAYANPSSMDLLH